MMNPWSISVQTLSASDVSRADILIRAMLIWLMIVSISTAAHAATPIATYSFDEVDWDTNGVVQDNTASYNATINGAVTRIHSGSSDAHTSTCSAAQFSGGALDISGLPVSTTAGAKTSVTFWMYWDGRETTMPMGWPYHNLFFRWGALGFNAWRYDSYGASSAGLANGWHHIAAVFTNNDVLSNELYIDGVKQNLGRHGFYPENNPRAVVNSSLRIGGIPNSNSYRFTGAIDEFKVYNGALTQAEVTADFTYTSPNSCPDQEPELIASYAFDDNWSSGSTTEDNAGSADGSVTGNVSPISAPASGIKPDTCNAADFDGGAIDISNLPVATGSGDTTSISFWMKWNGKNNIIPLGWSPLSLWLHSGHIGFYTGRNGLYGVSSSSLANNWHHITIVINNNDVYSNKLFIDGVEQSLSRVRGSAFNQFMAVNSNLRLGGWHIDSTRRFEGALDEVKIYNGEISQATIDNDRTIASPCTTTPTPIAEYRFDEISWGGVANEVIDSSGNNLHGQAQNGLNTSLTAPAVGNRTSGTCQYGEFGGFTPNHFVSLGNPSPLNFTGQITMMAWIRPDSADTFGNIISHGLRFNPDEEVSFRVNNNQYQVGSWAPGYGLSAPIPAGDVGTGRWVHLAGVYDGTAWRLYRNGVQIAVSASPVGSRLVSHDWAIGSRGRGGGRTFDGGIDEVRIYDTGLTAAQIQSAMNETRACNSYQLDHFQLSYTKSGLTCMPSAVTIKACSDTACNTVVPTDIDVTLTPSGWSANPATLSNGQGTFNLTHHTVGNLPLNITANSLTSTNTIRCLADNAADASCSIDVAEAGFVFDVPKLTACKPSSNVTIKALKQGVGPNQCVSALTGNKQLSFWSSYDTPASGTTPVQVNSTAITTSSTGTPIYLNFDANGEAQFTAQYDDAGRVNLYAKYDDGAGIVISGSDNFVSTPVSLVSYSADAEATCTSEDANCSVFKKAGENFNLSVKAACWTHDGDTNFVDNPATPNFELAGMGISHNVVAPSPGVSGDISVNSLNFSASTGIQTVQQSVSEVGVFKFNLTAPSYLGETLDTATSPAIGRFTPDDFSVTTANDGRFGNSACTGFSYSGQTFSYLTKPQLTITAYNTDDEITQNYRADFAKLQDTDFIIPNPTSDAVQLGSDNATLVRLDRQVAAASLNDNSNGTLTFELGNDQYTYEHEANSRIAPFTNAVNLKLTSLSDSDGISASGLPHTLQPNGEPIRFGRIAIESMHGSELVALTTTVATEYFNGYNWMKNTADACTVIDLTNHIGLRNPDTASNALQSGNTTMTIGAGTSSATLANANPLTSGSANLTLSAPGLDNQGYVDVSSRISASYPWLRGDYDNDGGYDDEAQGRVSFGLFRGSDKIIFRRERF